MEGEAVKEEAQTAPGSLNTSANESVAPTDSLCPHLLELWEDPASKDAITRKYKSIVIWASNKHSTHEPPQKKRKVNTHFAAFSLQIYARPFRFLIQGVPLVKHF